MQSAYKCSIPFEIAFNFVLWSVEVSYIIIMFVEYCRQIPYPMDRKTTIKLYKEERGETKWSENAMVFYLTKQEFKSEYVLNC